MAKNYQAMADAGLLKHKQKLTVAEIQENLQTVLGAEADTSEAMASLGLSAAIEGEARKTVKLTAAKIQEMVTTGKLTEVQAQELAMRTGVILSMKKQATSTLPQWIATLRSATKVIWEQVKATATWLVTTPAGWATLATLAVIGLVKGVDLLTVSVEEQRKKLDELKQGYSEITSKLKSLNSELNTTKQRMNELENIESLSFAEKEEYNNLVKTNNELQRQIDLLELEEKIKKQDVNKAFVETMEKDTDKYNDKDDEYFYYSDPYNPDNKELGKGSTLLYTIGGFTITAVPEDELISVYESKLKDLEELDEEYADRLEDSTYRKKREKIEQEIDELSTYLQNKSTQWTSDSSDIQYIKNPDTEDDKAVNEWLDYIADFQDRMAIAMGGNNAKENAFNRLVDNWLFDDTVQGLQNLGEEGKVTAEMLDDPRYNDFINKLVFLGVIDSADNLDDIALAFNRISEAADNAVSSEDINRSFSNLLTSSTDSLDKFQSSVKSAADAYTTLLTGNYSSSELLDSIQAINKAASEMGKSIDWEAISASDNPLQAIQNQIESVSESYANSILNGMGIDVKSDFGKMLANIVQETYESEAALSSLNKQIDSLQSAYNSLTDIVSSYNETGHITFDQLQTLLAMEPQYLSCLIDEQGQLQLNQEAMLALANQRLDDAEVQAVQQAITELGKLGLQNEKTAVEENAVAFNRATDVLTFYNAELANTIGEASVATSIISDLNAELSDAKSRGATGTEIDTVLNNLNTKLQLIKTARAGLNKNLGNIMGGSSSGSSSSSSSEFSETIDFFERRVNVLNDSLDLLKSNLENVTGSFAKNKLVDAELSITEEKFRNYSDALSMYSQKAEEALSKLPDEIASKVKDGAVSITDFIGEGNKDVVEAIKDYESWADKVSDCTKELSELKKEIRQLELEKFNNIISDFTNQFDLRENSKDLISKQVDLLKEAGELIGESFYSKQIEQSQKQLTLLEEEKAKLIEQMTSAIGSERVNCVPYSTVMWFKTK